MTAPRSHIPEYQVEAVDPHGFRIESRYNTVREAVDAALDLHARYGAALLSVVGGSPVMSWGERDAKVRGA